MAKQTFSVGQTLTAAQMTSLQQTAMLGGAASAKTASYTLVAADAGTAISMTSASATTITVNTALFAAGDTVQITNLGAGVCTITAGTATVNTSASLALAQYESGTLDFTSTSAAIFIKGAGAAASSGGMTLISETVANASSGISFTGISGSYKQLLLVWSGIQHSGNGSGFAIRFNNDSGSKYVDAGWRGTNGAGTVLMITQTAAGGDSFGYSASSGALNRQSIGWLCIDNYSSATKDKTYRLNFTFRNETDAENKSFSFNSYFDSTTAITSLDIVRTGGSDTISNVGDTTIRLYGVA